jgi:hypothetical protein
MTCRNTGTTNSFTSVNLGNLTGGLFELATLLEGNNLACYVYQLATQAKPDILNGPVTQLLDVVRKLSASLSCPQLQAIDDSQLRAFPGYTKNPVYG